MRRRPSLSETAKGYLIRGLRLSDLPAVEEMYVSFEPLGFAKGLPPVPGEKTKRWLRYLADHGHSLIAEGPDGFAGHAILAESAAGEAELAVFVHQHYRRQGLGKALASAAVQYARLAGYRRLWATASATNGPAIRMVKASGFTPVSSANSSDVELELRL